MSERAFRLIKETYDKAYDMLEIEALKERGVKTHIMPNEYTVKALAQELEKSLRSSV